MKTKLKQRALPDRLSEGHSAPPCAACGSKLLSHQIGRRSDNRLYLTVFYCPKCSGKPPRFMKC